MQKLRCDHQGCKVKHSGVQKCLTSGAALIWPLARTHYDSHYVNRPFFHRTLPGVQLWGQVRVVSEEACRIPASAEEVGWVCRV